MLKMKKAARAALMVPPMAAPGALVKKSAAFDAA